MANPLAKLTDVRKGMKVPPTNHKAPPRLPTGIGWLHPPSVRVWISPIRWLTYTWYFADTARTQFRTVLLSVQKNLLVSGLVKDPPTKRANRAPSSATFNSNLHTDMVLTGANFVAAFTCRTITPPSA